MGTDVAEVVEKLPSFHDFKLHGLMCLKLMKIVDRVVKIFPEIEAARPRCSSGIQSLCLLNEAIDKAKLLLQDCTESSKLYLALTANTILSRCKRSKSLLEQSLSQIQNMVPVMLASEISQVIAELRKVTFNLDPSEEDAGKVIKALLEQYKTGNFSTKKSAIDCIRLASLKLKITSKKALLMERRSIKKLLNKLNDSDDKQKKKMILIFLLDLLKKYSESITSENFENGNDVQIQDYQFRKVDSFVDFDHEEGQTEALGRGNGIPPEEFKCPISLKLMHDPVIIDSGQTFERMWIQKWFNEGHNTCPKTKMKLSHVNLTPNTSMKDLISRWCEVNGVNVSDPFSQLSTEGSTWENSSSSINSLTMSMNNLQLPIDYSNVSSLGSLDNSQSSLSNYDVLSHGLDESLPWEFRCKAVEDLMIRLKCDDRDFNLMDRKNLVDSLIRFLKISQDEGDVKAQRIGCLLLLIFVSKSRRIPYLNKDTYLLIATFLESEVIEEALAITELLSSHQNCRIEIAESGALTSIFKILDTQINEIQTPAIKILYNLTSTKNIRSFINSSDLIPKMVPIFENDSLSRYCIGILTNLCENHDTKSVIAATNGCLFFVSKVLESGSCEEQEQALEILLSLCSQSIKYCHLVMDEGVIPSLCSICVNGNDKGKAKATEMLRLLKEIDFDDNVKESNVLDSDISKDSNNLSKENTSSRAPRIFSIFSRSSLAHRRKI